MKWISISFSHLCFRAILWKCWQTRIPYNETRYLEALRKPQGNQRFSVCPKARRAGVFVESSATPIKFLRAAGMTYCTAEVIITAGMVKLLAAWRHFQQVAAAALRQNGMA